MHYTAEREVKVSRSVHEMEVEGIWATWQTCWQILKSSGVFQDTTPWEDQTLEVNSQRYALRYLVWWKEINAYLLLAGRFKAYISNFICIIWKICIDDWGGCGSRVGYLNHWNRLHVEKVLQFPNITSPPTNQPPDHAKYSVVSFLWYPIIYLLLVPAGLQLIQNTCRGG